MKRMEFNLLPTMIGSMPYTDATQAMLSIIKFLPHIPTWPQLPKRGYREYMVAQYSEYFPGLVMDTEGNSTVLEKPFNEQLQKLYEDYLGGAWENYGLTSDYAAGFFAYMQTKNLAPLLAKGQMVGPLTFALSVKDQNGKAIIYDKTKREAVGFFLGLKAIWQERTLQNHSPHTLIFLDEPVLASFGSAYLNVGKETVVSMLNQVYSGLKGLKGIHVCGGTDWEMLLSMPLLDVINFDTYSYAHTLQLYQEQLREFWQKGKAIAWGIVPTDENRLKEETVSSLRDRLEETMAFYTRGKGSPSFSQIAIQSLLTPTCGLNGLSPDACTQALQMLANLSDIMRRKYI